MFKSDARLTVSPRFSSAHIHRGTDDLDDFLADFGVTEAELSTSAAGIDILYPLAESHVCFRLMTSFSFAALASD